MDRTAPSPSAPARCPLCGAAFSCSADPACWCMKLPPAPRRAGVAGCLCPACLKAEIEKSGA